MLKALVVSPTPTWPLNYGNRKRVFSTCNELQKLGVEIYFIHYASEVDWRHGVPLETVDKMNEQWTYVSHLFPSKDLHCPPNSGQDHEIDEWFDWEVEHAVKSLCMRHDFDFVYVNYTWLSKCLEVVPDSVLKVLDTHDVFSDRRLLLDKNGINPEYFHTTKDQECLAIERADVVYAIKDEEKEFFKTLTTKPSIKTLLHFDELRESEINTDTSKAFTFGIIGARNNINKVNVSKFIDVATPIFKKYLPQIKVLIAGSMTIDLNVVGNDYFESVGYVDDLNEFYDTCDAMIIPMEFSTGLKIKVAEAFSQSKPTICHHHAAEGFPVTHPFHLCESFEDMAVKMCELSYDPSQLHALRQASLDVFNTLRDITVSELSELKTLVINQYENIVQIPNDYPSLNKEGRLLFDQFLSLIEKNRRVLKISTCKTVLEYFPGAREISEEELESLLNEFGERIINPLNLRDIAGLEQLEVPKATEEGEELVTSSTDNHVTVELKAELYNAKKRIYELENSLTWKYGQLIIGKALSFLRFFRGKSNKQNG